MTAQFGVEELRRAVARPSAAGDARRTVLLVMGMHRAGTSALARTLSLLGAALPKELVPANEGNPHGHWEPRGMVDLNDRMLADMGSDLYSALDPDPAWFAGETAARFAEEAAGLIDGAFDGGGPLVLKDPRTALLAPVWNRALADAGCRAVHILPLRHPADVAASLRRRHLKSFPYDAWATPRGEAVWLRYTLAALRGSRGHARAFVRYGALIADWRREVDRLGRDLGVAWPDRGPAAERQIDAFLHGNENAEGVHSPVPVDVRDLRGLDLPALAAALHDRLAVAGDDGASVDAVADEFADRMAGARGLVEALEALYPLVWHHWRRAETLGERLAASNAAEAGAREAVQRHWAALTLANNDKLRHLQDLGSRDRQIVGQRAELDRLRREVADGGGRLAAAGSETERLRAALAARDAEVAALRGSTSWRVTRGLRGLSRAIRRRP